MRTVSRMYDNYADAVAVVTDLEAATDLTPNRQISMIANENAHGRDTTVDTTRTETTSEAGPGAGIGAIVGGGVGLLTGLGLLAIPGVGSTGRRRLVGNDLGRRSDWRGGGWHRRRPRQVRGPS